MVSLDGDGSTTFIITVSALLPIYLKLGMSPVVLTVVANLANGVLNIVPWGGPTVRAATVLKVSPSELFNPMVPGMIAGDRHRRRARLLPGPLRAQAPAGLGPHAGAGRRRRCERRPVGAGAGGGGRGTCRPTGGSADAGLDYDDDDSDMASGLDPNRPTLRPKLIWFNLGLTVALLTLLGLDMLPLALVFIGATAIALVVNFPKHRRPGRRDQGARHRRSSSVVAMVFAAAVLVGRAVAAPGWSPRWPTGSSPRCRRRSGPGSP